MTLAELIAYYQNLLILQYNGLPKASASAALIAQTILSDNIVSQIEAAYNIAPALAPTAVGTQLDVIGKYVGINRYFSEIVLIDYSAMVTYSQHASLPASPVAFGLETYATFIADYDYNGTLQYKDVITIQNALSDASFLTLIQLAILRNNMNFSDKSIDKAMWVLFGSAIRPEEGNITMTMFYFFLGSQTTTIQAILAKNLLPKPMGVWLFYVIGITGPMFSMVTYALQTSPFGFGYSTYANYATLAGQVITYSMIQEQ